MPIHSSVKKFSLMFALSFALSGPAQGATAVKETTLYSFTGGVDGYAPNGPLIADAKGNLFGTTFGGGAAGGCGGDGCGVVFELSPSAGTYVEKTIYQFSGSTDGASPNAPLTMDKAGNLYGTASGGGINYQGVVYELSPMGDGSWKEQVLHAFTGMPDGDDPVGGLVFDKAGNLYGTTPDGGSNYHGTAYELSPQSDGTWVESVIYAFNQFLTGPEGGLVIDQQGNLYGTVVNGGTGNCEVGCGQAFELSLVGKQWAETILYNFLGGGNGKYPQGALVVTPQGQFVGVLGSGGNGFGIVFGLGKVNGTWNESLLYNVCSRSLCIDGSYPGLTYDAQGTLFATMGGGGANKCGVIATLKPTRFGWQNTTVYTFGQQPDGCGPRGGLLFYGSGNAYGTTGSGGKFNRGTIYKITGLPPEVGFTMQGLQGL